jgi:hypothetical protein
MTLQLLHSEFPYIRGKFDFLFYQCIYKLHLPLAAALPAGLLADLPFPLPAVFPAGLTAGLAVSSACETGLMAFPDVSTRYNLAWASDTQSRQKRAGHCIL